MGAPFTQAFIQLKIDFFAAQMEVATEAQQYSYDQGPVGQFGVQKASLEKIQKSLEFWIELMNKWYPNAYAQQPNITLNEIGFLSG